MDIQKILNNIDDFFANTPKQIIDEIDAKVAATSIPSVSLEEYLDTLANSYDFIDNENVVFDGNQDAISFVGESSFNAPFDFSTFLNSISESGYTNVQHYEDNVSYEKCNDWPFAA